MIRSIAIAGLAALACVSAAPVKRQLLPGSSVNGPTALSNPDINNGAKDEGVLKSGSSFDGAQIINPMGNTMTDVNQNTNLHDNVLQNPNFNVAKDTQGPAVVGNNNEVFPAVDGWSSGIVFKRQNGVNGPTALSNPNINNGAMNEGVLKDATSFDGAAIVNPTGNDLTKVNQNTDLHDNLLQNPNFNVAQDTRGPTVVGNNNEVIPVHGGSSGIVFKRQNGVNGPTALSNPNINNGAMREGSLDSGMSADGAAVTNPVGNDLTQVNQNQDISGNNLENPNFNSVSNNNGPALAGNNNVFVPVTNEQGAIQFDNSDLMQAALIAGGQAAPPMW
ncbi:hypothetical protein LPJ78_001961 [Coemansia sp. RSA 989]|nr:hypothetical protein BX667DRAFT_508971 [Coemansia mojavensis]KAJ1738377.1 hypothetical protein LPJ68_005596 [Coemansia sp. RSA 1086]KAJ1751101.1 hypothetical protein LPJ79_002378 [Coemansia sp. RSA 1821]KAJ1866304.1 hypothetical protein LPJ78_001961 [Coemansia sp. RSA 989]KAJ1870249.1 hypothetical protein LPJ55_004807 [Coemansia sp. RSA 990]KAJ2676036.1 hypothetical protein IWW42_000705 [Coemansia sp. RSA 1085]